ncbi:HsdM family class I SAM-dependent methyltransferase, partial [uncultured Flavonifractor sp.]|uniref:HsdM family class I SAM-dependent methyltransferase n=1 Tax=uncultured Flavonifractor sp. TaxID=1193534 RepID=UPI003429B819
IITFKDDVTTIIVVECKKSVAKHETIERDHPKDYAVDGALYYAKFLKEDYNVIAVAVSGTKRENFRASAFLWNKGQDDFTELRKARDIILEPRNYIDLVKGKKIQREYSLDSIRETAIDMHTYLREIKMTERHKPIFIAGLLIALNDDDFAKTYINLPSFNSVITNIATAIDNVLRDSGIKYNRIQYIKQAFKNLLDNSKFAAIPLGNKKSIVWYIEELEMKIKPMMDHADSTIDALGVFYHEFIKYSGGDGSGLGIVLTPQHLTEFMCNLAGVNKNSRVVDICCGSGSFLVTAMSMMFRDANPEEVERIREDGLYGVEFDDELYTLAVANMIIRKDGKSNIEHGDCFKPEIVRKLKSKNINIGLINPPYSQDDVVELEFVEHLLDILAVNGTGVVVVPMSCAIGTKFKDVRKRLFQKHTLDAVFSMPDDIFYPTGTNVCVMVWKAHCPHDSNRETFFGYCKDDGFVKRKKLGRVDAYDKWSTIEERWLNLYRYKDVEDGLSARHKVTDEDEWLCEAYMKTDYSKLGQDDFQQTVNDYLAYLIRSGEVYEDK